MTYDKDIREPLFDYLEERFGKIRMIEEKTMGRSRADVAMDMEQALYGIEIKSDADTYARLAGQTKDYDRYYDYNVVVAGASHGMQIEKHVPDRILPEQLAGQVSSLLFERDYCRCDRGISPRKAENIKKSAVPGRTTCHLETAL